MLAFIFWLLSNHYFLPGKTTLQNSCMEQEMEVAEANIAAAEKELREVNAEIKALGELLKRKKSSE